MRTVRLDLRVDAQMADTPGRCGKVAPHGLGERADRCRVPGRGHGPAGGVGEAPWHRARPADEDLRAEPLAVTDAVRRPAVDGLDPGPGGSLEVRAGVARGDEPVPVRIRGHDLTGRRSRSAMTPTIDGSSGIRKASEATA